MLGLDVHDVAEAMRSGGATRAPTVFQARVWTIGAETSPGWLVALMNEADLRDSHRADHLSTTVEYPARISETGLLFKER